MDHRADLPATPPWRSAAFIAVSVATVELLILLVVGDLPVVHDHDEPGVYNEECPLGRLATCPPGASAPEPMPAPGLLPMFDALVPSVSVEAPAGSIAPSAPRAPPVLV